MSCLFCRIRDGEIPATKVHDDEHCFAIRDLNPQAPHHILVIPRDHIATLNDLEDGDVVGKMFLAAKKIAADLGVAEEGWRALFNVNKGAGQSVFHIHLHLLAGRPLGWPPG